MLIQLDRKSPKKNYVELGRSQMSHNISEAEPHDQKDMDTKTEYRRKDLDDSKAHVQSHRKLTTVEIQNAQANKVLKLGKPRGVYDPNE